MLKEEKNKPKKTKNTRVKHQKKAKISGGKPKKTKKHQVKPKKTKNLSLESWVCNPWFWFFGFWGCF